MLLYYHIKDRASDEIKPGKKGITLNQTQWEKFASNIENLMGNFYDNNLDFQVDLGNMKFAGLTEFRKTWYIYLR